MGDQDRTDWVRPFSSGDAATSLSKPVSKSLAGAVLVESVVRRVGVRAGAFIVTLYGDVVEPRGGRLSMANIVDACQAVGISETLVRTAVSRLVSAGQLIGERQGRRSFYSLTEVARSEYLSVSRLLFEVDEPARWCFAWIAPEHGDEASAALTRSGFVRLGPNWYFGPGRKISHPLVTTFECVADVTGGDELRTIVESHWDLAALEASYAEFLSTFQPVADTLDCLDLADAQALHLRLLVVHAYRLAALRDVRLPPTVLPDDWSGRRARLLFASLYLRLSARADHYVARHYQAEGGLLPERTLVVEERLSSLLHV